ncbi:MAG TPA: type 1 glutamine amidotransferase [Pyrinomonadaceae bacterium]
MKVHVFQHAPFEDLGSIRCWLDQRGAEISYTRWFAGDAKPALAGIDMLIAMGGPMSVNDEQDHPWLKDEKLLVRDAITRDIPVLGICLGAQLIASALGARVYGNAEKEIGWFPIQGLSRSGPAFSFPSACTVFHWHGETFDLPEGATSLARSEACEHQAFQLKRNVIGLQFHLEMTPDSMRAMVENCRHELVTGRYVQSETELSTVPTSRYANANELMGQVMAYLST